MKHYFSTLPILALSVVGVFAPNMKADEWNKKTNITINQAIEVEGTDLPAGSYVLKLVDLPSDRHLVQILNAEENRVVATVFTIPIYRFTPPDNSEFKFYESETGRPPALHTWFYPGDSTGFEFKAGHGAPAVEAAQVASATASNGSSSN
jgi:hypothetical protein